MPRRTPWNGHRPETPDAARRYLIEVAREIVDEAGFSRASLAEVAERAGVTRQTVYRYFEDTDDLFRSALVISAGGLWVRMLQQVRGVEGWPERLVEAVVFVVREIPKDPNLSPLLRNAGGLDVQTLGKGDFAREAAIALAEGEAPIGARDLEELTELMLRLVASFLRTAEEGSRSDDELRAYLSRWIVPAIRECMERCQP